jgi:photosystem II stability/assembly factor-like uncharacterized protein
MKHTSHTRAVRFLSGQFYFFSIFIFINAFNFQHNPPRGWYQQFLPDLGGANILEINFLDSLNGYAKTGANTLGVSYLLKTSTGGDNWTIARLDSHSGSSAQMKFLNKDSGVIVVNLTEPFASDLFRTTDGGNSWDSLSRPVTFFEFQGISVVSINEIWAVDDSPFSGAVWRSLDGGQSWERMLAPLVTNNPDRIYMVNSEIGFVSDGNDIHSYLKKTTDGGVSWNIVSNGKGWYDIYFRDSLNGWKAFEYDMLKTTNGGSSWNTIHRRTSGVIGKSPFTGITQFSYINTNYIWGVSYNGDIVYLNGSVRGVLIKTMGSENLWGFQIPDTSFRIRSFGLIDFPDSLRGSSFGLNFGFPGSMIHTVTGGDSITNPIMNISNSAELTEKGFELQQNYPNPFNSSTTIQLMLVNPSNIELNVYDVTGKLITVIAKMRHQSGTLRFNFDASGLPSGSYIYSVKIDGKLAASRKMILLK